MLKYSKNDYNDSLEDIFGTPKKFTTFETSYSDEESTNNIEDEIESKKSQIEQQIKVKNGVHRISGSPINQNQDQVNELSDNFDKLSTNNKEPIKSKKKKSFLHSKATKFIQRNVKPQKFDPSDPRFQPLNQPISDTGSSNNTSSTTISSNSNNGFSLRKKLNGLLDTSLVPPTSASGNNSSSNNSITTATNPSIVSYTNLNGTTYIPPSSTGSNSGSNPKISNDNESLESFEIIDKHGNRKKIRKSRSFFYEK